MGKLLIRHSRNLLAGIHPALDARQEIAGMTEGGPAIGLRAAAPALCIYESFHGNWACCRVALERNASELSRTVRRPPGNGIPWLSRTKSAEAD